MGRLGGFDYPTCGNCLASSYGSAGPSLDPCAPCLGLGRGSGDGFTCGVCSTDYYSAADGTISANTACTLCRVCTTAQYQTAACSPGSDASCGSCAGQNRDNGADGVTCGTCTTGFYNVANGATGANTACAACQSCAVSQYPATECQPSSDAFCSSCASLNRGSGPNGGTCGPCSSSFYAASDGNANAVSL